MGRRLAYIPIAILGLLGAAAVGLVAFRAPLLEAAALRQLTAMGVPAPSLTVRDVGVNRVRISDLRLGANGELRARSLTVNFAPEDLIDGRIEDVAVEGLLLQLDLTGTGPVLGSLQPLLAGGAAEAGPKAPPLVLPLTVRDGTVHAMTPLGVVLADIDGAISPRAGGLVAAALSFRLDGEPGRVRGGLVLSAGPDRKADGTLTIADGTLALPGADLGGVSGKVAFTVVNGLPTAAHGTLSIGEVGVPGAAFKDARIDLRLTDRRLIVTGKLRTVDERATASVRAVLDDYFAEPHVRLAARAEVDARAGLWNLLALPAPGAGRADVTVRAEGRLPPLDRIGTGLVPDFGWLASGRMAGHLAFGLTDVAYPGAITGLSGELSVDGAVESGTLHLTVPRKARLEAGRVDPTWLHEVGVPPELAALLSERVALSVPGLTVRAERDEAGMTVELDGALHFAAAGGAEADLSAAGRIGFGSEGEVTDLDLDRVRATARQIPLPGAHVSELRVSGRLGGAPGRFDGDLDVSLAMAALAADPVEASEAVLDLPVRVRSDGETVTATVRGSGRITADMVAVAPAVQSRGPLSAQIAAGEVTISRDRTDRLSVGHAVELLPGEIRLALSRAGGEALEIDGTAARVRVTGTLAPGQGYRGRAKIEDGRLALAEHDIALDHVFADVVADGAAAPVHVDLTSGTLRHLAPSPAFAPVGLRGQVRRAGDALEFFAEAPATGGPVWLTLAGRHDTETAQGDVRIALGPLSFVPGGLQPAALVPALAGLRAVAGGAVAEGRLAWAADDVRGEADLDLAELSFESAGARVEGLSLDLRLDRLRPPASPPGQRLTIRRVDPGVPLTGLSVLFQVQRADPPRLAIQSGELSVSGGRLFLRDALIDPGAPRQDFALEVEGLDLAELFRRLKIKGLSATGRLSGTIPIAFEGARVTIADGRLDALGPGVVRYRSEEAAQVLGGAGQSAQLLIQALQNFHYEELSLTVRKPPEGDARLALVLLGRNPDVLDGYPFRLNINLAADVGRILAALSEVNRLSNAIIRRAWLLGR